MVFSIQSHNHDFIIFTSSPIGGKRSTKKCYNICFGMIKGHYNLDNFKTLRDVAVRELWSETGKQGLLKTK